MGLPVERKVTASTAAAALSGLLLWIAGRYIFKGSVPDVVVSWVYVIVPSVITFMAGYAAKHTPRPVVPPVIMMSSGPPVKPVSPGPLPRAEKTLQPPAATETLVQPPEGPP